MERIDILSPKTIGQEKIGVTLDPSSQLLTERPITVNFNFSRADAAGGVVLPLLVSVVPVDDPEKAAYRKTTFRSSRPDSFTFIADRAGTYLVLIRESAHNRWVGRLRVTVKGDKFASVKIGNRF